MDKDAERKRALESFFAELDDRLKLTEECEARIACFEAPRFNLFNSTYVDPDENKITTILADLLDPQGSHGQGSVFISSFFRLVGFGRAANRAIEKAQVRTQHPTDKGRYIDLTAQNGKCLLGLENKIDADEEAGQIADYIAYLRSYPNTDWFIVFLTPDDQRDPKTCDLTEWNELRQQGKAQSLSYSELSTWLISCISHCKSDRVCALLQDMAKWATNLRRNKVGSDFAEKAVNDFVLRHPEHFKTTLAVADASTGLKSRVISDFAASLEMELLKRLRGKWSFTATLGERAVEQNYAGMFLRDSSWPTDCTVGIEAQGANLQSLNFGVAGPGLRPEVKQRLKDQLDVGIGKSLKSTSFIWCRRVPDFRGIRVSCWWETPSLLAMHDERRAEMIDHFVELINKIVKIADPVLANIDARQD